MYQYKQTFFIQWYKNVSQFYFTWKARSQILPFFTFERVGYNNSKELQLNKGCQYPHYPSCIIKFSQHVSWIMNLPQWEKNRQQRKTFPERYLYSYINTRLVLCSFIHETFIMVAMTDIWEQMTILMLCNLWLKYILTKSCSKN